MNKLNVFVQQFAFDEKLYFIFQYLSDIYK